MLASVFDRLFAVDGAYWLTVLVDATIKATILLSIVVLLAIVLRTASASIRHLAWRLLFVGLLTLPVLGLVLPSWQMPNQSLRVSVANAERGGTIAEMPPAEEKGSSATPTSDKSASTDQPTNTTDDSQARQPPSGNDSESGVTPESSTSRKAAATTGSHNSDATSGSQGEDRAAARVVSISFVSPRTLLFGWVTVAIAALIPLAMGIVRTWTLLPHTRPLDGEEWNHLLETLFRQLHLRRRVTLRETDAPIIPITWGLIRPMILLPAAARDWSADRRRVVLLHELAHVKHWDVLTQMVSHVACALYWFHPLAWFASFRLRAERELACDDLILSTGTKASDYSRHLLEIATSFRPIRFCPAAALGMARRSGLETRLRRILEPRLSRRPLSPVAVAMTAVLFVSVVVSLASAAKVVVVKDKDGKEVARIAVPKDGSSQVVEEKEPKGDSRPLWRLEYVDNEPFSLRGTYFFVEPVDVDHDIDLNGFNVAYPADIDHDGLIDLKVFNGLSFGHWGRREMPCWPKQTGLIPRPAELPGVRRWQLETVAPRGQISSICWSADGRKIAFVDACSVRVYEVPTFRLVRILTGHAVTGRWHGNALAWSPDSQWFATGGCDGTVRLWKTDGTPGPVMEAHSSPVISVRWSRDGRRLASAGYYGGVCIWNADGTLHKRLPSRNWLASLSWSPDGQQLAVADLLNNVQLWNVDGSHIRDLRHNVEKLRTVAWNPNGTRIASGGYGNSVYLWSPDGTAAPVLEGHSGHVHSVAWSPDGKHLASGSSDETVRLWQEDGTPGPVLKGHQSFAGSVAWSPDGSWIATGDSVGTLRLWEVDGTPGPVLLGNAADVSALAWSPDGKRIAMAGAGAGGDGFVRLWSEDGSIGPVFRGHANWVSSMAWSPDGRQLASASGGEPGRVWKVDGSPGPVLDGDPSFVVWSPDGKLLAGGNETVGLSWHAEDGTPASLFDGEDQDKITAIAWSPDGKRIATANDKAEVRLRTLDGEDESILEGSLVEVDQLVWSPDGALLASASSNHLVNRIESVRLWRSDGTAGPELDGPSCHVKTVTCRPDGKQLAITSGNPDNALWLWTTGGGFACEMAGWGVALYEMSWSSDSRRLASAAGDGSIWIWNIDGTRELVLQGHQDGVRYVAWNPHSNQIVSTGYCGRTLRSWDADAGEPQWVSVLLRNHRVVTFGPTGKLLNGDPDTIEQEFVYVVETDSGAFELIEPSKFQNRLEADKFGFFLGITR